MKYFEGLSPAQIKTYQSMIETRGELIVWPEELTYAELLDMEERGIIYHVFHGPATYGATTYHIS